MSERSVNLDAFQAAKSCILAMAPHAPNFPVFDHMEVGSNTRALVLVPHVDDEIMGCGGTMCRIGKRGAHMKVVYMTGSAHEHNMGCDRHLVRMDKCETDVALRALRCFDSELLNPELKGVRCDDASYKKVASLINDYEPDVLFVPCFDESRSDYLRTAAIAARALEHYPYNVECYCYSFDGVHGPNALVDITLTINDKIEAMKERRSQHKMIDDEENIRALHQYTMSTKTLEKYCERFNRYPKKKFITMAKELGLSALFI
jgi:LmbE family N-acetylglucosaminyl deacetylase